MNKIEDEYFQNLSQSEKIIFILKRNESFGGPQSAEQLNKMLQMKRKNLDSLLSRLFQKGRIVRLGPSVYGYPGDHREPKI